MKIRIYDDSIRLRLDRAEVGRIGEGDSVDCVTRFPGGDAFHYRLAAADVEESSASFTNGCMAVTLPRAIARHWAEDDSEVSIRAEQRLDQGALTLLIEKDFECLDPREGEDQSNRFKNPKALGA